MPSKAIFAAGNFWDVQNAFEKIDGVIATVVGYIGGQTENPTYLQVAKGDTGHAEAVEVIFDSGITNFDNLLNIFFSIHNPTSLNRQGPDVGTQYRSAIFYLNEDQRTAALSQIALLNTSRRYANPVVTEVTPASRFWTAEEYHQKYLQKPGETSCVYKI